MPESSVDPFVAQNLKESLRHNGKSAYAVAIALGRAPNWLYRVMNGKSGILIPTLREVAEEIGVSLGSLVNSPKDIERQNVNTLSLAEVAAKPETRATFYDEAVKRRVEIPRELLPDIEIDTFYCQLIRIEGTGMTQAFPDGSLILVHRLRRELQDGGTFVLLTAEEGLVVRQVELFKRSGEWIILGKDGTRKEHAFPRDTSVVGQVIGSWLNLLREQY